MSAHPYTIEKSAYGSAKSAINTAWPAEAGFGIYIHWPYCLSKCPYCDFNSHVTDTIDHGQWAEAYAREIAWVAGRQDASPPVNTIYFGGGTPSLMAPATVERVLETVSRHWQLAADVEITLEANPTSVEMDKMQAFASTGVNRVSLGVQSLREEALSFLGRRHSASQAREALQAVARYFDRFSIDLIYARLGQSLADWEHELQEALDMGTTHISLYQLTIEPGTPFFGRHNRGEFMLPPESVAADLYDLTRRRCAEAGLIDYEVSNYARPGLESRHNLIYWRYGEYAGIGPGAHGRLLSGGTRQATRTHRAPDMWLKLCAENGHGHHSPEALSPLACLEEAILMGLRLEEGVPYDRLQALYGGDISGILPMARIETMIREAYLADDRHRLRATRQGRMCLNALLEFLLA